MLMRTELVIQTSGSDAELALLQDGRLVELVAEKGDDRFSVGDIYLGRVKKVAPGLNAAFVDVGHAKDAFLHYHDLGPQLASWQQFTKKVLLGKQPATISDFQLQAEIEKEGAMDEAVKVGQDILVQIIKEPISTKGPRITSEISLAGRFMVLVPFSDRVSVSQKIRERKEKERLRRLADSIRPKGFGLIVRTVAENKTEVELTADLEGLMAKWKSLHRQLRQAKSGQRVVQEMDRASAFLRDVFNESFTKIHVDNEDWASEVKQYLQEIAPDKADMVKLYSGTAPIFQHFNVDRQVKTSFGRTVTLQKGAYLIIEHTEALHVIDVNSGNRGAIGESQEEGALAVNLLAAEEVARQLRLRDMGGIIVVDFIDLHSNEHRRALYDKVTEVMSQDRAKHKILPPSKFGLVEITRQRVRPEKAIETQEENPDILVDAPIVLVEKLEQEFASLVQRKKKDGKNWALHVHPFLHAYLTKGLFWSSILHQWQRKYKGKMDVIPRDSFKMLEFKFQ
jgi:ribonuclease G